LLLWRLAPAEMSIPAEQSLARFLEAPTRFLFFTGKGGVGKTSLACASAIALADGAARVAGQHRPGLESG
jgi:DNA replication protein DnaC